MSSKGQVVIPLEVRQRAGFRPGSRLEVTEAGGEVRLRLTRRPGKTATVEEGRGLAGYKGPPVSIDQMNAGVREYIRGKWKKGQ